MPIRPQKRALLKKSSVSHTATNPLSSGSQSYEALKQKLGIASKSVSHEHPSNQPHVERFADGSFEVSANVLSSSSRVIAGRVQEALRRTPHPHKVAPIKKPLTQTAATHVPTSLQAQALPISKPHQPQKQVIVRKVRRPQRRPILNVRSTISQIPSKDYFPTLTGKEWAVKGMTTRRGDDAVIVHGVNTYFAGKIPKYLARGDLSDRTLFALVKNLEANHITSNQLRTIYPEFIDGALAAGFNAQSRILRIFYLAKSLHELGEKGINQNKLHDIFTHTYGDVHKPTVIMVNQWPRIQQELHFVQPLQALLKVIDERVARV